MASKKLLCFLIVYFFVLGSATYCNDDSDCFISESCCSDKVCRQRCYNCSYDYRCGTNEQCCNNKCTSSSSTCSCSYDYQCQISEQCCNSKCISSSSSCTCSVRRTTTNVDRARSAVIANASVVRLLVTVRTTPIVTLERIVVGEFVRHHTVVGVAELLQALLSAQLYSSPSSFPLCPVSAVLVARTTAILHPVLWSSPANSHNNKWSQLTHTWRRNKYMFLRRWNTISLLQLVTNCLLKALIRHLRLTWAIHRHQTNTLNRRDKLKRRRCRLQ